MATSKPTNSTKPQKPAPNTTPAPSAASPTAPTETRSNTTTRGRIGESRAARYYTKNGYEIIARNYRTKRGEIDIIARRGQTLVFAEVKRLPSGNADTLAAELRKAKRNKIVESAKCFLKIHREYSNSIVRFDAVLVDLPGFPPVYLIENAFSENEYE